MQHPDQKTLPPYLKPLIWALLIAVLLFLYFIPDAIQYSDYRIIRYINIPLIWGFIPLSIIASFYLDQQKIKGSYIIFAVFAAFLITSVFGVIRSDKRSDYLNAHGIHAKAIVSDQLFSYRGISRHRQIRCRYMPGNLSRQTYYFTDDKTIYKVGDTLDIVYNKDYPRMYNIDMKRLYQ
jgi:hypothetical protein